MDQVKIGMFISICRKKQKLTQAELAEKLGITDRAVSKWETGRSLPDASLMFDLCAILNISVNDLLSGEVVTMNENNQKQEQILIEMVKEKEKADKRLLTLEWILGGLSILILLIPIIIGSLIEIEDWKRLLICFSGFIPCFVGVFFCMKIEQVAGYYECGKCGHKYVPTFKQVNLAMHMGRTRYLKCPHCGKKSWNKKVINK